jgi:hypothetical protein
MSSGGHRSLSAEPTLASTVAHRPRQSAPASRPLEVARRCRAETFRARGVTPVGSSARARFPPGRSAIPWQVDYADSGVCCRRPQPGRLETLRSRRPVGSVPPAGARLVAMASSRGGRSGESCNGLPLATESAPAPSRRSCGGTESALTCLSADSAASEQIGRRAPRSSGRPDRALPVAHQHAPS